ncbi:MAG: hypothetical protein ACREQJ_02895, partial [Candidatus Binatia bacterium]
APRGADGRAEFRKLVARPVAKPHRDRIAWLPLERRWRGVSATDVRAAIARGEAGIDSLPAGWAERLGPPSKARRGRLRRA